MSVARCNVAIVGAGPRGLSVLERICSNARKLPAEVVAVTVVDPFPPGAGAVWRARQSTHLLMNTVASQVTVFTDDSVTCEGPPAPGPSLYEWTRFLALMDPDDYEDVLKAEAATLRPDSYSSRALYGSYLEWVFTHLVRSAPPNVVVTVHRSRAVALDDAQTGSQMLRLEDGTMLDGLDAVVLAQGHVPVEPTEREAVLASAVRERGLTYVPPANPADVDLTWLPAGRPVILRGLGLNFFDHMALLTIGRGGRFHRDDKGDLRYLPSGREPKLVAGSRRGVPYHARGENQKGPHGRHEPLLLTPEVVARLRNQAGVEFGRDVWPLVAKEVETVYYSTLLQARSCCCHAGRFRERYLAHPRGSAEEARARRDFGLDDPEVRWSWEQIAKPFQQGRDFRDPNDFRSWLLRYLRRDVAEARLGNVDGPLKAALDAMRDLRNEIRLVVDHCGITGPSYRDELEHWYTPLNAFVSIGPPASRIEEMIALIETGVLDVVGPDLRVELLGDEFVAHSPAVPGARFTARALIEARLPETDVRRTTDPLLRHLLTTGQARPYEIPDPAGEAYQTGGLAVTERPYYLVDARGVAHRRRFAFGVPTEAVHWVTAAGIRPGVNSVSLQDSDAIARAVLRLANTDVPRAGADFDMVGVER